MISPLVLTILSQKVPVSNKSTQATTSINNLNLLKNKHFQFLALIILILTSLILLIIFIILPYYRSLTTTLQELEHNQELLQELESKTTALNLARRNYQAVASQSALIDQAMPNYSDIPLALNTIENITTQIVESGGPLVIQSLNVSPLPNDQPAQASTAATLATLNSQQVEISVSFMGDYQAIRDFITILKSYRHNYVVDSIRISAPRNSSDELLSVSLNLYYYYFQNS